MAPRWFLGFDCATKTLAFSLFSIDFEGYKANKIKLWEDLAKAVDGKLSVREIKALDKESKKFVVFADGEVKDLFPGRPDASIHTVERIKALADYVNDRILPSIAQHATSPPEVVVEFQMGPNAPARTIAAAIIALFHKSKVYIVGPTLKNKMWFCEKGKYCYFVQKYKTTYCANKAHAAFNFSYLETLFGTKIPSTKPTNLRGHIADSVMQVFGHLRYGNDETPEMQF